MQEMLRLIYLWVVQRALRSSRGAHLGQEDAEVGDSQGAARAEGAYGV